MVPWNAQSQMHVKEAKLFSLHATVSGVIGHLIWPNAQGWDQRTRIFIKTEKIDGGSPLIPGEGVNVVRLEGQAGVSFNLSQIEAALEKTRPKAFFITHGESSTGCLQNLEGIGALCHKYGALCCVDSVAACGGVPLS